MIAALRFLLLAALLLPLVSLARDAGPYAKGLLWQIQRSGSPPSHLYGTIHSEDGRVLALPKPVAAAFDGACVYVMEARLDEAAVGAMSGAMMLPPGERLDRLLDEATWRRATQAAAGYGLPEFVLAAMKPWAVAMTFALPPPRTGVFLDLALMQRAQARGIAIAGLEMIDEQIAPLDQLSAAEQLTLLKQALDDLPDAQRLFADLHAAYLARDLARLLRLTEAQAAKGDRALNDKLMAQMLDARNRRMVDAMEPMLREGCAFVAIGALHLPGRQGVLALLAQRGWRVRAVY